LSEFITTSKRKNASYTKKNNIRSLTEVNRKNNKKQATSEIILSTEAAFYQQFYQLFGCVLGELN